jgi:hypothetical protein
MKEIHPGDTEIQCFVFDKAGCQPSTIDHMQTCTTCNTRAALYTSLAGELQYMENPTFEFDVAAMVIQHLDSAAASKKEKWTGHVVMAVAVAIVIFTGYSFGNNILALFRDNSVPAIALIVGTACLVTVFAGLDVYKRYKQRIKALENNGNFAT